MRRFLLVVVYLTLVGCATSKPKLGAPTDTPKPKITVSSEKMNSSILSISKSINEANFRAEKIRLMLDNLE
jgi:hypothetical protein